MIKRMIFFVSLLVLLALTACDKSIPDPVFHISGSPNPVLYGDCGGNTLTLRVTGPGENIRIDGIIASYILFNGSGDRVKTGSITLAPVPGESPTSYAGTVTFDITTSPVYPVAPEDAVMEFGEGRVEFGAFVDAWYITAPDSGPYKPVGHTEELSLPVLPCPDVPTLPPPTATVDPSIDLSATTIPFNSYDTPPTAEAVLPTPSSPPSCSVEPNNPNCVP